MAGVPYLPLPGKSPESAKCSFLFIYLQPISDSGADTGALFYGCQ
jgi:hypothetical protein